MSTVCRLTTVVALLLHLIFGCSLHHATACGTHGFDGCNHACGTSEAPGVHQDHDCAHAHDCSDGHDDNHDDGDSDRHSDHDQTGHGCSSNEELIVHQDLVNEAIACNGQCQSVPCDGDHPGCHGDVECSFVPSSDVVFFTDAPFVAFMVYDHDPLVTASNAALVRGLHERHEVHAVDSLSHCASLCTWLI